MSIESGAGDQFQLETRYSRYSMPRGYLDWNSRPKPLKLYEDVERIQLPPLNRFTSQSLWALLQKRRSERQYSGKGITLSNLSELLWAAQGVTRETRGFMLRTAPSAGALYPVETYLAAHHVQDLEPGLFHYAVSLHALERLSTEDLRSRCRAAALDQAIAGTADALVLWTAVFPRSKWKYGQRAYRYVYLDAGHIAQNLALAAVDRGLGSCQIAAFYDDEANRLLGVDGKEESIIYMTAVGAIEASA